MNVPIRMIGIATTIFWAFIILFAVSALYSIKDARFDFGDPQISTTSDNKILFSLPLTIVNTGYYDIGRLNATTEFLDDQGSLIASGSTFIRVIRRDAEIRTFHNVTIAVNDVVHENSRYLFNDAVFRAKETIGMQLAEVIPVQASGNHSLPWGAPLYHLALGTPQYSLHNATHMRVDVPISFENHASYGLVGTVQLQMHDSHNALLGTGQTAIDVPQHSPYNGNVPLYIQTTASSPSGRFEISFTTSFFTYGPIVMNYE